MLEHENINICHQNESTNCREICFFFGGWGGQISNHFYSTRVHECCVTNHFTIKLFKWIIKTQKLWKSFLSCFYFSFERIIVKVNTGYPKNPYVIECCTYKLKFITADFKKSVTDISNIYGNKNFDKVLFFL